MIYIVNESRVYFLDFTPEDWNKLKATGKKQLFFGRKFEPVICQSMLDEVDLWVSADNKEEEMHQQTQKFVNSNTFNLKFFHVLNQNNNNKNYLKAIGVTE